MDEAFIRASKVAWRGQMLSSISFQRHFTACCLFLSLVCFHLKGEFHGPRTAVRSFDVFDTLVGRVHKDPHSVFRLVEKKWPFPGFTKLRIEADKRSDGTLDDIYRHFIAMNNCSLEEAKKLRAFELEIELNNVFPIMSNLSKVQDGDILVSDTYYNSDELMLILKKIGLNKKIDLFATNHGKSKGYIWPQLRERYYISSHLGDNYHSDVLSPGKYGIKGLLCNQTSYTEFEQRVCDWEQQPIANLIRALRLVNPYSEHSVQWEIWNEQAKFNVPALVLASISLNAFCQNRDITSLLFLSKGCCHFAKIFKHLFPDHSSDYLQISPNVCQNPTPEYIRYVQSLYSPDTLIVGERELDSSLHAFFSAYFSVVPNYITIACSRTLPHIFGEYIPSIGYMNVDRTGTLLSFGKNGPIYAPPEYELEYVQPAHDCVKKCLSFLDEYTTYVYNSEFLNWLLRRSESTIPVLKQRYINSPKE